LDHAAVTGEVPGRFRGNVFVFLGLAIHWAIHCGIHRRAQCLHDSRPSLGGQPGLEHIAAVVVDEPVQLPQVMAQVLRLQRLGPLDASVALNQALDMGGRAVLRDHEQILLIPRRRHARHGADLGEADPSGAERVTDPGQVREGVGDADLLPGGAHADAAFPVEPMGAGLQARPFPALALVELADQDQETVGGGGDMRGQLADFVGQGLQRFAFVIGG
jgi:hypothetical protein